MVMVVVLLNGEAMMVMTIANDVVVGVDGMW